MSYLIFDKLRASGLTPRVHPNGFIQLDIAERERLGTRNYRRLHVWTYLHRLVHQKTWHPIHDHRFDMKSEVIVGTLINKVYAENKNEAGGFVKHHAIYTTRHDAKLLTTNENYYIYRRLTQVVTQGKSYSLAARVLHSSEPARECDYVATIMETSNPQHKYAVRVMVPEGVVVDNSFDRFKFNDVNKLWDIIEAALKLQKQGGYIGGKSEQAQA